MHPGYSADRFPQQDGAAERPLSHARQNDLLAGFAVVTRVTPQAFKQQCFVRQIRVHMPLFVRAIERHGIRVDGLDAGDFAEG